jgi:phosphate transport system substrate-binding protein
MSEPGDKALQAGGLSPVRRRNSQGFPVTGSYFYPVLGLLILFLVILGCDSGSQTKTPTGRAVCIAGSTSIQPFAEKLAEVYMHHHPGARIDVQGGGSSAGIFAARQGAADLGASSRELIGKEKKLIQIPIAYDGIAVIVHPSNPLTNMSLREIHKIFLGQIKNWRTLGLPPHSIDLITREAGSGTREAFEHLVMGQHEITPAALVEDSNGSVREIVAGDPYSLGYISAGLVNEQVKALAIDGVLPTTENIKKHKYKLVRRFLLVSRAEPAGSCKAFLKFVLGPNGQKILEKEGLVGLQ